MSKKFEVQRYTAYFKDWCQAFGEHQGEYLEDRDINWLYADNQLGLILSPALKKGLYKEMLGPKGHSPVMSITAALVSVGDVRLEFSTDYERKGMTVLRSILETRQQTHMYLTYHILYPHGVRIITFSSKTPLNILYKQIDPLLIELK